MAMLIYIKQMVRVSAALLSTLGIAIFATYLLANATLAFAQTSVKNAENDAVALIFLEPYLKKLDHPATIAYHYSHETAAPEAYGPGFDEEVRLNVNPPSSSQGFNSVAIVMKDKAREYTLGPFEDTSGNPVVMMFLERDLNQMRSRIGGAPVYFRNTIRRAFRDAAVVDDVNVDLNGVEIAAKRITIKPFVDEAGAGRFGKFQGKVFETIVSDRVPGGILTMRSFIPDDNNADNPLVLNELQFTDGVK